MKQNLLIVMMICLLTGLGLGQGGDLLNEVPLYPIPEEMTFEEYQDMNRRLTVGLAIAAVPVPGLIHFYAGEKKTGAIILGTAVVGLGSIIAGAAMAEDGDFPDSDFSVLILNEGDEDRERRFEEIPYENVNGEITYKLREINREPDGAGIALIAVGAGLLVADILYDFIHGIRTIEKKRDAVRYKYGRSMKLGFQPQFNLEKQSVGVGLALNF